jgi:hypothetical protein
MPAFSIASRPSKSSDILLADIFQSRPHRVSRLLRAQVQSFDLSQTFWCRGPWGIGFNEQIFGTDESP